MTTPYDKYYQKEKLFGDPFGEVIAFFSQQSKKGKVLDLGCGQGRNAIALARLGYSVLGLDISRVGIEQLNKIAQLENINLTGKVEDIYSLRDFTGFDFLLLDSMFHFNKKDLAKETRFINNIMESINPGTRVIFCLPDTGRKVEILNQIIKIIQSAHCIANKKMNYIFNDNLSGHQSETDYRMIIFKK